MKFAHKKKYDEIKKIRYAKSRFDLSHSHQGSYDWGKLYPIMCEEVSPGDVVNIGQQIVAKMMPTIAPPQHEINAYCHYFFVPTRIIDDNWETFITGGKDGTDESSMPLWTPNALDLTVGSLWDHFGFPMTQCSGTEPLEYPKRAYRLIWNEYYRDENLQTEIDIAGPTNGSNLGLKTRSWEKDYFTASLPWQQRGIAPALPISGTTFANFLNNGAVAVGGGVNPGNLQVGTGGGSDPTLRIATATTPALAIGNIQAALSDNVVDFNEASTFDVSDLRTAFQIQRFLERNARAGVRYTEFLEAHFDESPTDDRLQRPEYIGGYRQPVTITEILQVSETGTTPQGNRSGIGSVYGSGNVGSYKAYEFGYILGIFSIMPRSMYTQGVNRMFLRRTRYDFLFPEFVNLSEQAVLKAEIFASGVSSENTTIFGYQGRYDELRQRNSRAVGLMRQSTNGLIYWNLSRQFATAPSLNEQFITVEIQALKDRVFAVPEEPGFIITFGNILTVSRALPTIAEPGLIDHD